VLRQTARREVEKRREEREEKEMRSQKENRMVVGMYHHLLLLIE
jgi:hypothetical protein